MYGSQMDGRVGRGTSIYLVLIMVVASSHTLHTHTHTHTHAHTLHTLFLSHTHNLSLSRTYTYTYTHSLSLTHTLSLSLTHTHADARGWERHVDLPGADHGGRRPLRGPRRRPAGQKSTCITRLILGSIQNSLSLRRCKHRSVRRE